MTSQSETTTAGPTFGLWYDFRNPDPARPFSTFYREVLDQISWAEQRGIGSAWLTEHHFCADGYSPSPFVLASAIAQRTGRLREFEAFGRKVTHRPSLLEEGVEIIRRAWSGSAEGFSGKRYHLPPLAVTPVPEQVPALLVGAMAEPAIERAARIADGFLSTQNAHHESYLDAVERQGGVRADARIYAGQWAVVADDPERVWASIGKHALYQLNEYISWGAFGPPDQVPQFTDPAQILEAGAYQLMDAEAAVTQLTTMLRDRPQIKDVHFWAQLPGEPVDSGSERIAYLADKVVPAVREQLLK
jgi:alkanesulfonate monooxygenase SsuD/methylene tetrahydromethanopterin reductase-like flavin-dependent oxidoreductase (luciferase family)